LPIAYKPVLLHSWTARKNSKMNSNFYKYPVISALSIGRTPHKSSCYFLSFLFQLHLVLYTILRCLSRESEKNAIHYNALFKVETLTTIITCGLWYGLMWLSSWATWFQLGLFFNLSSLFFFFFFFFLNSNLLKNLK
jgi:hypothetical protein